MHYKTNISKIFLCQQSLAKSFIVFSSRIAIAFVIQQIYLKQKNNNICDDEQDLLQVFGLGLESEYNIILANSGGNCIEKFIRKEWGKQIIALRCTDIDKNLLIEMNNPGLSFDEIADYLDKIGGSKY